MLPWMRVPGFQIQEVVYRNRPGRSLKLILIERGIWTFLLNQKWARVAHRSSSQCEYSSRYCDATVLQQHYPMRKRPPRTPKCAQMPLHVNGNNANTPDDN